MIQVEKFFLFLTLGCITVVTSQFIYLNSGVFKFIAGIGLPIDVSMSGGSVSWFTNFQVFYKLPDNITYYEPYKVLQKRSLKNNLNRSNVYGVLEKYFQRLGLSGSECIQKVICQVASGKFNQEENGLIGEIIHTLFTPGRDLKEGLEHKRAHLQGKFNNSQCEDLFRDCHVKGNFLKNLLQS